MLITNLVIHHGFPCLVDGHARMVLGITLGGFVAALVDGAVRLRFGYYGKLIHQLLGCRFVFR